MTDEMLAHAMMLKIDKEVTAKALSVLLRDNPEQMVGLYIGDESNHFVVPMSPTVKEILLDSLLSQWKKSKQELNQL